ncbi:MAG: GWxTD domain-containing protein [Candidatus Aminicenantes bacterium]|nr:GWxTD domain-containing protein [Candidatus Aminicenantes bacterium]
MKNRSLLLSAVLVFLLSTFLVPAYSQEDLLPQHQEWLEFVSPIITKLEREVFLMLKTTEERNNFVKLFYKKRDPLPDTEKNEFLEEYTERVRYADRQFGHDSPKKGSQTERGYFYIVLGPPLERQRYTTQSDIWPLELWYYKGEQQYGLPPYFYLIFYQRHGIGEYRLFSPEVEGPASLVVANAVQGSLNRNSAYRLLREISGELAKASLSMIPDETTLGVTSMSTATVLAGIHSLKEKKFSDSYARNYPFYKDYVETDYSHDYIECHYQLKIFDHNGQDFLHWAVEPDKVNLSFHDGNFYAAYQLIIRMEASNGNPILEKEEEIPIVVPPEQSQQMQNRIFAFQDILPIIPGQFIFHFLLKNKTAGEFTSFQATVLNPKEKDPRLNGLILYHSRSNIAQDQQTKLKAFTFSGTQYIFNTRNNFLLQNTMGVFGGLENYEPKGGETFSLNIYPAGEDNPVFTMNKSLEEVLTSDRRGIDTAPFSLSEIKPGYYRVSAAILDPSPGKKIMEKIENFVLLSTPYPVFPRVYSRLHTPYPNVEDMNLLATQFFMTGNYPEARILLEQSLQKQDNPATRLLLAKVFYGLKDYEASLTHSLQVYEATSDREAAKVTAANYTALKDWSKAVQYLEELLLYSTEISVLNQAAECYLELSQPERALPLIGKSLELDPDQAEIKKMEERVKKILEQKECLL